MEVMSSNGDKLLELFDTLDIELRHLNPNVIKAWFDTDCEDTKHFLNWLCTSITKENFLSPQEDAEASELPKLTDDKYQEALIATEKKFPGIFDEPDSVQFELELLEDEKEMYTSDLKHLEKITTIHEKSHKNLCNDVQALTKEEIHAKVKLEEAETKCKTLAEKLDDVNMKLFNHVKRYGGYLYDFEFATDPQFISNMRLDECEENLSIVSSYLNTVLKREYQYLINDTTVINSTIFTENSSSDSTTDKIDSIRNRIFHSWQNYLHHKLKEEELKAAMNFLNTYNTNTVLNFVDCANLEMNIETKTEQKCVMFEMIDNISSKYADYQVSQPKLHYAAKELEVHQLKLEQLTKLQNKISQLLSSFMIINALYVQESKDIEHSDLFFKQIVNYITNDLRNCNVRIDAMSKIIEEFNIYNSLPLLQKVKLVNEIMKYITDKEEMTLMQALTLKKEFSEQITTTENQICNKDFDFHKATSRKLKSAMTVLNDFLMCGPTCRIITVPYELYNAFKRIDGLLENQSFSIKSAVQISTETLSKLSKDKWLKNRRHLWMHFINDPPKMFSLLQAVEEEYNNKLKMAK